MKNIILKYASIYAIFSISFFLGRYFLDKTTCMNLGWQSYTLSFIAMIGIMYLATKEVRTLKGGFIPFGEAFIAAFLPVFIASFVSLIFSWGMMHYIDPSLIEITRNASLEQNESMYRSMGMNEEDIFRAIDAAESQLTFSFLEMVISGLIFSSLFSAVFAAIMAAIVKKNPKVVVA